MRMIFVQTDHFTSEKPVLQRQHEYSIRIDRSFRLIFQIETAGAGLNRLVIAGLENYHRG